MSLNSELVNAMLNDNAQECESLISRGANPNCRVDESWRRMFSNKHCLNYAVLHNKLNAAKILIEKGADLLLADESYDENVGPFPLFSICYIEEANHLLRLVIQNGCDIQKTYHYHSESYEGTMITGYDYDEKNITYSAMRAAIKAENSEAMDILLEHGYKCSDEEIQELIKAGNDRHAFTAMQTNTIRLDYLLWAIENKRESLVKEIIFHMPHLAKEDAALDVAVSKDLVNTIRLLIKHGANGDSIGWLRRKLQTKEILDALDGK